VRQWLDRNKDLVERADNVLAPQINNPKSFGEHASMSLCDEIFGIVKKSVDSDGQVSESSSVLLLGEASSGKTHAVEYCIAKMKEVNPSVAVLRAHGRYYASDVECVRHLAQQVAGQMVSAPRCNSSFEQGMDWLRQVLVESFQHASAAVIVLDRFEHFCSRARQTLLYNLFDIAQDLGVCLSIIGMSEKLDVMGMLEKRIKSRFSMRHLHAFRPANMEELIKVMMIKVRLPADAEFKAPFVKEFHQHVESALRLRSTQWHEHLEAGQPPLWFLWKCLPIKALLHDLATAGQARASGPGLTPAPAAKRARMGAAISPTDGVKNRLLLESLAEADLIVLLALFRLQDRNISPTLARALYEVQMLHEGGGFVSGFVQDRYCAAFDRLDQMKLIRIAGPGSGDTAKRYLPCGNMVSCMATFVQDLERTIPTLSWSPLRTLPQPVQNWAARQRH